MENELVISNVNILKNLMYSFTRLRLENELSFYYAKVLQSTPKNVVSTDSFFDKFKKNTSNMFNNSTYEKYTRKRRNLEQFTEDYIHKNFDATFYSKYEIKNKVNDVFKNDTYGIAKLELVMNIILDDLYEFETDTQSFSEISLLLGLDSQYLMNTFTQMKKIYSQISLNKSSINTKALAIASLISIPLIISGVGALIGGYAVAGSITTAGLASAGLGLGMAEGVVILCLSSVAVIGITYGVTYKTLNVCQKNKLKDEFAKLSVDQTTISLVKTMVYLLHMKQFHDQKAKELYNSYIEEYIDLKSDCDMRLFLKEEKIEENKDKNSIFVNADLFLKNNLLRS